MPKSVLQAIQEGVWDFEPRSVEETEYDSTSAIPGSDEKLSILAERAAKGLPLWHQRDCRDYEKQEREGQEQAEPPRQLSPAGVRS